MKDSYYFDEDIQQWVLVEIKAEVDYGINPQYYPKVVAPVPPTLPTRTRKDLSALLRKILRK